MTAAPLIVGTAGHIDHGKTSLVRALTGVDLDVLPEERERGITIALGFCPLTLPSGRRIAFVDVPGHERLVRTMIAGAQGVDAALLVVSAMEGVMPQTREHLAILELLDVPAGLVVLSKVDLVDADLRELASEELRDVLRGTRMEHAPILPFSAVTGEGREALLAALEALAPRARDEDGPFRLPVDRAFSRSGFGTIVTGTTVSGQLKDGANVTLLPSGRAARVRGVEVHGEHVGEVGAGRRVALNLPGIDTEAVPRGTVVVVGEVPCASILDVLWRPLAGVELEDDTPVRVLLGTAERLGRLRLPHADRPDLAQLRLDEPAPGLPGDRFILRRTSPMETLGGGVLLDPWARKARPAEAVVWAEQLDRLAGGDASALLDRAGLSGVPAAAWPGRARMVRRLHEAAPEVATFTLGDRVVGAPAHAALRAAVIDRLTAYHAANPLDRGQPRRELMDGPPGAPGDRGFDALIDGLLRDGLVAAEGPLLRLAAFEVVLDPALEALREQIAASLAAAGLAGMDYDALRAAHPHAAVDALARLLVAAGRAWSVPNLGLVDASAVAQLHAFLRAHFAGNENLLPADLKDLAGLSRKSSIPLLEWLDRTGWTRRTPAGRGPGKEIAAGST